MTSLRPAQEAPELPPELNDTLAVRKAVDCAINHSGRLGLLLALSTMPRRFANQAALNRRMVKLQGNRPSWNLAPHDHLGVAWCSTFILNGMVESRPTPSDEARLRLNRPLGRAMAPAIAGAFLPLQAKGISLRNILAANLVRLRLLETLSAQPDHTMERVRLGRHLGIRPEAFRRTVDTAAKTGTVRVICGSGRKRFVQLHPKRADTVADILERRERLATDPTFRRQSAATAYQLMGQPDEVAMALRDIENFAPKAGNLLAAIRQHQLTQGISPLQRIQQT